MGRKSILDIKINAIEKSLDNSSVKAFTVQKFQMFLNKNRIEWGIPESYYTKKIIDYLKKNTPFKKFTYYDEENISYDIFAWKTDDIYSIMQGVKSNSYFAFYSALFHHQLTEQIPKTLYINFERKGQNNLNNPKPQLVQKSIDSAFSKDQRKTSLIYKFEGNKVMFINGKNVNRIGVIYIRNSNESYYITDLERTLIDCVIRPVYAGGVFEVLKAFKNSKEKLDVIKLYEYLNKMDYIYPYHQLIGFYLSNSGYEDEKIKMFKEKISNYKMYLTYNIRNKDFSKDWNIYYPKDFI